MNKAVYNAIYRTSPATQGLLNKEEKGESHLPSFTQHTLYFSQMFPYSKFAFPYLQLGLPLLQLPGEPPVGSKLQKEQIWVGTGMRGRGQGGLQASPISTFCCQGAHEVDQQQIISGAKQCSRHLNKKLDCHSVFFSRANSINTDYISKNIALSIFGNEAPKAALSNYNIQCLRPQLPGDHISLIESSRLTSTWGV